MRIPSTGCDPSPKDVRNFSFGATAYDIKYGGTRYLPQDIEDQSKIGACTAYALIQNAQKAIGTKYSADFQYLLQKRYIDLNWNEGSSIFSALKAAKRYGLLPIGEWNYTTQIDRDLGYAHFINKLKAISEEDIQRMLLKTHKVITAYASVPVTRDSLARAIVESKAGILVRFDIGREWWTAPNGTPSWDKKHIEPLHAPKQVTSGHAVTQSNFDGSSFRIANSWSAEWADNGTAYHMLNDYVPTEAWTLFYDNPPNEIQDQMLNLEQRSLIKQKIQSIFQMILDLLAKL